ncbi:MAG: IclR family transcriptional regulator [Kiloniellales bacterium]|nr:IclR family transcriptional regulator [Kiloniellales bacterium]
MQDLSLRGGTPDGAPISKRVQLAKGKTVEKATGTQLLDRAVAILKFLGDVGEQGARSADLAEAVSLTQPTAHRIIGALERHGLIEREQATRRYRLGLSLFVLGARAADGTGFRRICHPALLRLAAQTGDTVFLMARSGFNTVCVDRQEGSYMIDSLTGQVGGQIPLGVGPASQAILAFLTPKESEIILETNAPFYGSFNGLSDKEIADRLPEIREQGYAFDHGRLVEGISAIAVPILPQGRDVAGSLAINMTSARLQPERLPELIDLLRREVSAIEESINPLDVAIKGNR